MSGASAGNGPAPGSVVTMARGTTERQVESAVVFGMHPTRGYPVTWHITPVPVGLRRRVEYIVEQADGLIEDDEAWRYAVKTVELVTAEEARELLEAARR